MKINKDTWHYKLWRKSFTYRESVPEETDLCRYCHKVFWQAMGIAMVVAMVVALIGLSLAMLFMLGRGFWFHPLVALKITGVIIAVVVPIVLYTRWLNSKRVYKPAPKGLVSHWMTARKQSVCPLIEFESDEPIRRPFYDEEDDDQD